jgi:hypothetical protein
VNKFITNKLSAATRTVKVLRASIFEKIKVRSAVSLANLLARHDMPSDVKSVRDSLTSQPKQAGNRGDENAQNHRVA